MPTILETDLASCLELDSAARSLYELREALAGEPARDLWAYLPGQAKDELRATILAAARRLDPEWRRATIERMAQSFADLQGGPAWNSLSRSQQEHFRGFARQAWVVLWSMGD